MMPTMIKLKIKMIFTLIGLSFALAGCGFQPLHGTTASGELMNNQLSSVYVPLIDSRVGQQVRNNLLFNLTGGDYPDGKKYILNVAIKKSIRGVALQRTGDATSKIYQIDATFTLSKANDKKNKPLFKSKSSVRSAFDTVFNNTTRVSSTYAHIRAERDAGNRAAKTIAHDIKTRIAAYLSANS